jgi:hypothetical protein
VSGLPDVSQTVDSSD